MHSLYANTVSCYMRNEHLWTVAFIGDFVINIFRILREECIIESDERKEVKNESCALQKQKQFFGKGSTRELSNKSWFKQLSCCCGTLPWQRQITAARVWFWPTFWVQLIREQAKTAGAWSSQSFTSVFKTVRWLSSPFLLYNPGSQLGAYHSGCVSPAQHNQDNPTQVCPEAHLPSESTSF